MKDADIFIGCSGPRSIHQDEIKLMARDPLIFAMANPEPEIRPELVFEARPDAIMGTGRSDYPNQINNVMCFPFLFRGALDCHAKEINEAMKMAAAKALAGLAREEVPESVKKIASAATADRPVKVKTCGSLVASLEAHVLLAGDLATLKDNDKANVSAEAMLKELLADNKALIASLKSVKELASDAGDNATDGLLDDWTDQAEQRAWFLTQTIG